MSSQPTRWGQRVLGALVLILAVCYGVQLAASMVVPLAPALLVIVLLLGTYQVLFRRRPK